MAKLLIPFLALMAIVGATLLSDRPLPRADFAFINRGDVTTLDPQRMSWMQDLRVARLVFEGLVANDVFTHGYDPKPAVAESWDRRIETRPALDGTGRDRTVEVYTFRLRDDARWTNGEPVTAEHFVYSWRRAMLPDTASDYAGMFWLIDGAKDFFEWRLDAQQAYPDMLDEALAQLGSDATENEIRTTTLDTARAHWSETLAKFRELVGLRAIDTRTLEVVLERPTPYFLDLCAFAVFYPVYPPLVEQYDRLDPETGIIQPNPGWTKPGRLVSNGPFELVRWRFKRDMRLERNPHYWNGQSLAIDSIEIPSVEDPNAQVLAFETGAADWTSDVTVDYRIALLDKKRRFYAEHADEVRRLRAMGLDQFQIDRALPDDPRKNVHAVPTFGTYWYNFNCLPTLADGRPNPFHDARVRRAFSLVIDKRSLTEDVVRIGTPVARTLIPPGSIGGYQSPEGLECISDASSPEERSAIIERARGLLARAGYPDPSEFPEVELLFNKDAGHDLIAQAIAKDWQQHLGVPVRLATKEIKVYKNDLKNANYMTSRAGWFGDYGDPTTFLDLNRSDDGNNDRKYANPEYDALLDEAARETDPQRRLTILADAERMIMERDLPMVPLFHYVSIYLFDPDEISGINPHPRTQQDLFLIDVLGDGKGPDLPRVMRDRISDPPFAAIPDASASITAQPATGP